MGFFNTNRDHIEDKICRIPDGIPFQLNNLTIRITGSNLIVTWWTDKIHFKNITKKEIDKELKMLKETYSGLVGKYKELEDIVEGNSLIIEFHVAYDDAGKGGVGLCSEINGVLNWYI